LVGSKYGELMIGLSIWELLNPTSMQTPVCSRQRTREPWIRRPR